jgi:hypothetical protein
MEKYGTISEDLKEFTKEANDQKCSCGAKKEIRGNAVFCAENCGIIEKQKENK